MESNLKNQNVLVTGGAGLVGSHVVEKLLNIGANVFVMDIKVLPESYFVRENLEKKCVVFIQDIREKQKFKDVIIENKIDYIFHLAAQALVPEALIDPYLTLDTNILGTVSVLEAARGIKTVKGVVVASSDKAYGKNSYNVNETQPLAGDHPYDVSKSAADLICTTYHNTYNTPVTISRFGNIFGPGDLNFSRIVPGIMESLISNKMLELRSDGSFLRDYVYVKDVADGYIVLAEQIEKTAGQAFNFSSGHNFSVLDLIANIEKVLGQKVNFKIINNQKNEIPAQSLNFEKVQKILGWQPKYSFKEGVLEIFEWYKKLLAK
jgi:CDP-glucose 4,6-dehydratase